MPAEDLATAQSELSNGSVAALSDDDLLDALTAERTARVRAEQLAAERDAALARVQAEMRDLIRLRDNFHSLYREERALREQTEIGAVEAAEQRDRMQEEAILLRADVDRLERIVARLQARAGAAAPAPAATTAPSATSAPIAATPAPATAPSPAAATPTLVTAAPAPASAPAAATPTPVAAAPAPVAPSADAARLKELERDLSLVRAHAAELEGAIAQRTEALTTATHRVTDLEREVAMARTQLAGQAATAAGDAQRRIHELDAELALARTQLAGQAAAASDAQRRVHELDAELALARTQLAGQAAAATAARDAQRRIHELDAELATLRSEHADLRTAHDRALAARDAHLQSLRDEQARRENAERFVASAEHRVEAAVLREQEAIRAAEQLRHTGERAEQNLQAARATIAVLEQRVHDAEQARAAAEHRIAELEEELSFVRSSVLTTRPPAQPIKRGGLLRRRSAEPAPGAVTGHVETVGTAVTAGTLEVSGTPEDVESALHRRLFGGE